MPPLPFNSGQSSGLDELAGAPPLVVNQLVDTTGTLKPRPGLSAWDSFPGVVPVASPVIGMLPWGDVLVYVTADRRLWAVYPGGFVQPLSDSTAASMLAGSQRAVGLTTRSRAVLTGGGEPQKWDAGGVLSARLLGIDGWFPPAATHIASVGPRLVVNTADQSGRIQWSGLGENPGHQTWDALDYAEAEAKSDPLVAVADNANEAFAFGTRSLQVFTPDPYVGLAAGRAVNVGLLAPYSLVTFDDSFAFLDRERRFVMTDGRGFSDENVLSKPIESQLRPLAGADCWGFRMSVDRYDAGVWFFPDSGLGFIWNRRNNQWSEWRAWGPTGYVAPNITSAVQWPERNIILVGLDTGQIVKLDVSARTDMGQLIKLHNRTGFVSHGTAARKVSKAVRFVFKRGTAAFGAEASLVHISWRDDLGPFRDPVVRDLGLAGEYNPVIELRSTGVYRQRQWEVTFTSDADYTLVAAEEDFDVQGN